MFNLILNENMKIFRRIRTWVLVGLLLLAVIGTGLLAKHEEKPVPTNWKQQYASQIQQDQKQLQDPNSAQMPPTMRDNIAQEIKMLQFQIDNNIATNQTTGISFAQDNSVLVSLLTIFVVIVAGDIVASEFSWGTIKLLLIRPKNRTKILMSKYLATLWFALVLLLVLLVLSYLFGGMLFGFAGTTQPYIYTYNDQTHQTTVLVFTLLTYGLKSLQLLMIVTIAFMISAAFRSSALAISMSILIMFVGSIVVGVLSSYSWVKYVLFTNLDLMQYFETGPPVEGMTFSFSLLMLALYFVILHACAWLLFVKRDVAA